MGLAGARLGGASGDGEAQASGAEGGLSPDEVGDGGLERREDTGILAVGWSSDGASVGGERRDFARNCDEEERARFASAL